MVLKGDGRKIFSIENCRENYFSARYELKIVSCFNNICDNVFCFLGSAFSSNFENHCRRLISLLWHSCGHLYTNHWEQLSSLNLRSQYGLVVAHMYCIAKMYDLLENKELSALSHTLQVSAIYVNITFPINSHVNRHFIVHESHVLQLVRPAVLYHGCVHQTIQISDGSGDPQQLPSSKSGSWGGYPTTPTPICKPHSQTC